MGLWKFQSYQFRQINPDLNNSGSLHILRLGFNRINSGRSIPTYQGLSIYHHLNLEFQSYQFRQINPDYVLESLQSYLEDVSIVSIQADQSRLDFNGITYRCAESGFNRINSGRSIPTLDSKLDSSELTSGFNRINSGRSIPTATSGKPVVARFSEAEWRNLFF